MNVHTSWLRGYSEAVHDATCGVTDTAWLRACGYLVGVLCAWAAAIIIVFIGELVLCSAESMARENATCAPEIKHHVHEPKFCSERESTEARDNVMKPWFFAGLLSTSEDCPLRQGYPCKGCCDKLETSSAQAIARVQSTATTI